jgi:hypothetical protein
LNSEFADTSSSNVGAFLFIHTNTSLFVRNSAFQNCISLVGGCIYASSDSTTSIYNSTFIKAHSSFSNGGAIFLGASAILFLEKSNFSNCIASLYGGAIFADSNSKIFSDNCLFSRASSVLKGGSIYAKGYSKVAMHSSILEYCSSENGGAIYAEMFSSLILNGSILLFNQVSRDGGGIYSSSSSLVLLEESRLINNTAFNNGGAAYIDGAAVLQFKNSFICSNIAFRYGGGFFVNSSISVISKLSAFSTNTAYAGGAFFIIGPRSLEFKDSLFHLNNVRKFEIDLCNDLSGCGGALYLFSSSSCEITKLLSENSFFNNSAAVIGQSIGVDMESFSDPKNVTFANFLNYSLQGLIGSTVNHFKIWTLKNTYFQNEDILIFAQFSDLINQSIVIEDCGFQVSYSLLNFEAGSSFDLLKTLTDSIQFQPFRINNVHRSVTQFIYRGPAPEIPRLNSVFHFKLWLKGSYLGSYSESNTISLEISLCPPGHVLEVDFILMYKCSACCQEHL